MKIFKGEATGCLNREYELIYLQDFVYWKLKYIHISCVCCFVSFLASTALVHLLSYLMSMYRYKFLRVFLYPQT